MPNAGIAVFVNPTFLIILITLNMLVLSSRQVRRNPIELGHFLSATKRFVCAPLVLAMLSVTNSALAGFAIYMSYAVPWDIMQDIVSAQEFLKGRPLYPTNMNALMRKALQENQPRLSLGRWSRRLQSKELGEQIVPDQSVQAHPPLMTMCFAPFVLLLGVRGACLAFSTLSLALFLTVVLACRGLALHLPLLTQAVLWFAVLGWQPVISTLRWGQSAILLGGLLTVAWFCLRRRCSVLAGFFIGVAACLKMYPALLLLYLLFQYRRAFVAAVVTIVALTGIPLLIAGWHSYGDYFDSTHFIMVRFAGSRHNVSLLGVMVRLFGEHLGWGYYRSTATGYIMYGVLGCGLIGLTVLLMLLNRHVSEDRPRLLNLEFCLFVSLLPLLSPLAWDHYMALLILPVFCLGQHILTEQLLGGHPKPAIEGHFKTGQR